MAYVMNPCFLTIKILRLFATKDDQTSSEPNWSCDPIIHWSMAGVHSSVGNTYIHGEGYTHNQLAEHLPGAELVVTLNSHIVMVINFTC